MLLFGHIGITIFIATMLYLPMTFAVLGVLLPDIIDKGFFLLGLFPCVRFFGHSIFFPLVIGLLTYLVTRKWKFALAITLGAFLHLLQDIEGFVPWFYPFINYPELGVCEFRVEFGLFAIITESIGAGALVFTLGFKSGVIWLRKKFWNLLLKMKFW